MIEILLRTFFTYVVFPFAWGLIHKREMDPDFKRESDRLYDEIMTASTTEQRKSAARKLYDLQKNA